MVNVILKVVEMTLLKYNMGESFPKTMHICWQWSRMNNKQCLII